MLTKKDLIAYKKQNPSKYAHKYGHIDLDKLPDEGVIMVQKATTELDGSLARPTIPWNAPINQSLSKDVVVESTAVVPVGETTGTVTPKVDGGNTLEDKTIE